MTSFNLQNGVIFKEGFIKMFEKHYDIIKIFLIVIMIICFLISITIQCSKVFKSEKEQSIESRITYDSDGKEMQKIKKQIYSDQELK